EYRCNTVYIRYQLVKGTGKVRLKLRPSMHFRGHDEQVSEDLGGPYCLTVTGDQYELYGGDQWPVLRVALDGGVNAGFTARGERFADIIYRVEERRGYAYEGAL